MKNLKKLGFITFFFTVLFFSCAVEEVGPILGDSSTFEAPVIQNPATRDAVVFTEENLNQEFEEFQWERTNYGINLSTDYALEIDKSEDFDDPRVLATSTSDKVTVTNERLNNVMLSMGLPAFEESTVYMRLRSAINGYESEPLYSNVVTREVTTFQSSECGNFCTVGIIGSATPGGWDVDSDLRLADPERVDKSTWTTIVYLTAGDEVKFRANDAWDVNWGDTGFPTGTGTADGPNIPIPTSGFYKVVFNDETGDYTFTLQNTPVYNTIGIIGSATAGGWDADTDLTQDPDDPHVWTGTVTLTEGEVKFRADDDWADNWGSDTYPSGYGVGGGPNIPVPAGTFAVRFNDATGYYAFMPVANAQPYATVGIIGDATTGGWDEDTDLIQNPSNPFLWSKIVTLTEAEAKFRADNDWAVNWGGSDFPGGIATQDGPNIPTREGSYFVTFNSGTGEYYFLR